MAYIGFDPFKGFSPFTVDTFVGDGTTLTFTLSLPRPTTPRSLLVIIDGVTQPAVTAYGLDGSFNLLFTEAPPLHSIITVVHLHINGSDGSSSNLDFVHPVLPLDPFTFDGTSGPFQLKSGGINVKPYNEYYTAVYVATATGNFIFRRPINDYTLNNVGQITFLGTPPVSGSRFFGIYFGKVAITEVTPGSLNGDAFGSTVDFGSRNVYVDDPMDAREVANKEWVQSEIAAAAITIHTTDDLPEGTVNQYFTPARTRNLFNGTGLVTYNPATGVIDAQLPSILSGINQSLATTASPYFVDIHATGDITASGDITTATGTITANNFVGSNFTGGFTGQVSDISNHTTSELPEGTKLYFTDTRAKDALQPVLVHDHHVGCTLYRDGITGEYRIVVTAGGGGAHTASISNVTQASPAVVTTSSPHGYADGDHITITNVVGMTNLNGNSYYADVTTSFDIRLYTDQALTIPVNSTSWPAYVSGGAIAGGSGGNTLTSTDNLAEGITNLYWTSTRFTNAMGAVANSILPSSDNAFAIGSSSKAWTNLFMKGSLKIGDITLSDNSGYLGYSTTTGSGKILKSSDIEESGNLFFTTTRARTSLSAGTGISYNSTTGAITNTDLGSSQFIFKGLNYDGVIATAKSNTDVFEFRAGTGISLAMVNAGTPNSSYLTITSTGLSQVNAGLGINVTTKSSGQQTISNSGVVSISTNITRITQTNNALTGNVALDLPPTGVTAGTYQGIQIDSYGRVLSATNQNYLQNNQNITLTGDISGSGTNGIATTLATTGVSAATYGSATKTVTFAVDSKGRLTSASQQNIAIPSSQVTDFTTAVRGLVSAGAGLSYNSTTGVFTATLTTLTSSDSIDKLADVDTTTTPPVNGNVLLWNSTASQWKPGYVPFNQLNIGNITGNQIFDATSAAYFTATLTGSCTMYFTFDTLSPVNVIMIELTNGGAYAVTWPSGTKWPSGAAPSLTVSGVDLLVFVSRDAGVTWRGVVAQQDSR